MFDQRKGRGFVSPVRGQWAYLPHERSPAVSSVQRNGHRECRGRDRSSMTRRGEDQEAVR